MEQKRYVAGFLFSHDLRHVALIRKMRPEWQRGLLNAIGGKIESGETNDFAMLREWVEETGTGGFNWFRYCMLDFPDAIVHFYVAKASKGNLPDLMSHNDEPVSWFETEDLLNWPHNQRKDLQCISNVPHLLELARQHIKFLDTNKHE